MKVVINACYGGFNLSDAGFEKLIERGWTVTDYDVRGNYADPSARICRNNSSFFDSYYTFTSYDSDPSLRTDPDLIAVVEELGNVAKTSVSSLKIVEIPDDVDFVIDEDDGKEWVAEVHRQWS